MNIYRIAGKFGEFGEITSHSPIKTRALSSKSLTFAKLLIAKISRCKLSPHQTFPLYSISVFYNRPITNKTGESRLMPAGYIVNLLCICKFVNFASLVSYWNPLLRTAQRQHQKCLRVMVEQCVFCEVHCIESFCISTITTLRTSNVHHKFAP